MYNHNFFQQKQLSSENKLPAYQTKKKQQTNALNYTKSNEKKNKHGETHPVTALTRLFKPPQRRFLVLSRPACRAGAVTEVDG